MQLAVHCHKRLQGVLKSMQVIDVACGVGNVLSNKGAIAVLLKLSNDRTLLLVNCHLAAHDKKVRGLLRFAELTGLLLTVHTVLCVTGQSAQ